MHVGFWSFCRTKSEIYPCTSFSKTYTKIYKLKKIILVAKIAPILPSSFHFSKKKPTVPRRAGNTISSITLKTVIEGDAFFRVIGIFRLGWLQWHFLKTSRTPKKFIFVSKKSMLWIKIYFSAKIRRKYTEILSQSDEKSSFRVIELLKRVIRVIRSP